MEQRTSEWFAARAGRVTASRIADILTKTRSGYAAARADYAAEILAERLGGSSPERIVTAAMQWGIDMEPIARAAYENRTGHLVDEVGFVRHPTIEWAGASPDGRIGMEGLIEIKCPRTHTHIETMVTKSVPTKHFAQMQWQMACTTADWCDYISFDPRLPENLKLFIARVPRDDVYIAQAESEVRKFLQEIEDKIAELSKMYPTGESNADQREI